jgi:hypothetical protein
VLYELTQPQPLLLLAALLPRPRNGRESWCRRSLLLLMLPLLQSCRRRWCRPGGALACPASAPGVVQQGLLAGRGAGVQGDWVRLIMKYAQVNEQLDEVVPACVAWETQRATMQQGLRYAPRGLRSFATRPGWLC